ncbi:RHS repeat domain-containing protein [Flavobacterium litorale]|uniref:RHS repeat-associated core domain-containing protein n=1 Tax=Flavobacterium litorale TaxID=2856519 RepID=A0ABX8V7Y8_9FLAO|nr:RHS repeat-associated core domain-containing protein [Flavobacterium litorale]QYJ68243.1 RHS repeat-associated core domain-containing protein [Flavobacterium litorale]
MEYLPFGETLVDEHNNSHNTPFKFNGKEFDEETGNYYYSARYYDPKLSIFISVDPLTEKYPSWSSYAYCFNNPINFVDPTGMEGEHIDPSELMKKSKDHAEAFIEFAKSKEGKEFLDKYASKGQKLEYKGEVYYQADEAGELHNEGIDLNYTLSNSEKGSTTRGEFIMRKRKGSKYDVNVHIADKGFGSSSTKFNLLEAIVHESFLHVDADAYDFIDDGRANYSSVPKKFRYAKNHSDHYHISHGAIYNNTDDKVQQFTVKGFNILHRASKKWNLNFTKAQIRTQMWDFSGSLINVNPKTGELEYKP